MRCQPGRGALPCPELEFTENLVEPEPGLEFDGLDAPVELDGLRLGPPALVLKARLRRLEKTTAAGR